MIEENDLLIYRISDYSREKCLNWDGLDLWIIGLETC